MRRSGPAGYLERLAARAQATSPAVRPRARALFEGSAPPAAAAPVEPPAVEPSAVEPRVAPLPPSGGLEPSDEPAPAEPSAAAPTPRRAPRGRTVEPPPAGLEPPPRPTPPEGPAPSPVARPTTPPSAASASQPAAGRREAPPSAPGSTPPAAARIAPPAPPPASPSAPSAAPGEAAARRTSRERGTERAVPAAPRPAEIVPRRRVPADAGERPSTAGAAAPSAARSGGEGQETTVRVTIGRIEVRAVRPEPAVRRAPAPRAPRHTLEEHLRRRREGRA